MRDHAPYFDNSINTWRVIAIDDDGYYFNVIPDAGDEGNAKLVAAAMNHQGR